MFALGELVTCNKYQMHKKIETNSQKMLREDAIKHGDLPNQLGDNPASLILISFFCLVQ